MTFNYGAIAQNALDEIASKGRSVTLRRVTEGIYDPSTLSVSGASNSDTTIKSVITDYKAYQINNDTVQRHDRQALVAASNLSEPSIGDIIIDGSTQYKIVNIEVVQPGETAVLYKLQIRK